MVLTEVLALICMSANKKGKRHIHVSTVLKAHRQGKGQDVVQRLTSRAEERGAGVAARDAHDSGHHQVLDEGARDDDLERHPEACLDARDGDGANLLADGVERLFEVGLRANKRHRLAVGRGAKVGEKGQVPWVSTLLLARHGSRHRLLDGDVNVLVHLLVVDDDVHVVDWQQLLAIRALVPDLGRGHAVELADLGRALEHLHRVGVVGDLVLRLGRRRGEAM